MMAIVVSLLAAALFRRMCSDKIVNVIPIPDVLSESTTGP